MLEHLLTRQQLRVEDLGRIDVVLRATYPLYGGLSYDSARQLLRLLFAALPTEEEQIEIGALVNRAPVFSRRVTGLFERRPIWR